MTVDLALEYIPRRMAELGFGSGYHIHFRHMVLEPNENRVIKAFNQLYLLVEEAQEIRVASEKGVFELSLTTANELVYEHQGVITITNLSGTTRHARFIQVTPYTNKQ